MSSLRSALSHRDFRYLMLAFATTQLGDWLYNIVLLAYVYGRTHSAAWVGATSILRILPIVLFGAAGGLIADRHNRRTVMIASDVARAVIMVAISAVVAFSGPVVLVVTLVVVASTLGTPHLPAVSATTPALVPEGDLGAANSLINAIFYAALALGPALGGVIAIIGSASLVFAINAATFVVSAVLTSLIRLPSAPAPQAQPTPWEGFVEGVRAIKESKDVSLLVLLTPAITFVPGNAFVLLVLVSKRFLEMGAQGANFLFAAIGVGSALTTAAASRLANRKRPGVILLGACSLTALPFAALAFIKLPPLAYAALAVTGAATMILEAVQITMLQRLLAPEVLGRIFGINDTLIYGGILFGSLVATVMVNAVGLGAALILTGVSLPLVVLLAFPRLQDMDRRIAAMTSN